jgi:amino acid transporter
MIQTIVVSAADGIYIAFQMIVLGAVIARIRGWQPSGIFHLGRWGWLVNLAALTYGLLAIINMMWPRNAGTPWYNNYGMIVVWISIIVIGILYAALFRPYDRGDAPAGDAHLNLRSRTAQPNI